MSFFVSHFIEEYIITVESSQSSTPPEAKPIAAGESALSARRTSLPGNLIRGAMIGTVETVPGVSGGTVALVVGIYRQLIDSASHVVSAGKALITGPDRRAGFIHHLRQAEWKIIIPVMIGMVIAVFTVAGPMATAVETYP
ncbi:undecaprenyl phosphate translocase family protein, partial [Nesterenkonia sandarakina]